MDLEGIAMSRYQALIGFVLICYLIGCTIVTIKDSPNTCVAVETENNANGKKRAEKSPLL